MAIGMHRDVLDDLGGRIASGELAPGTVLTLSLIEKDSGASRTVVREAVRVLESIGLVSSRRRVGITVQPREGWDAFSPQRLMRRFVQYRRGHELRKPLDDAGAWQTYCDYCDELASSRPQGFEMLFNEVYAQVYDRVLRDKQREPEA